jgi:hypothetical protein
MENAENTQAHDSLASSPHPPSENTRPPPTNTFPLHTLREKADIFHYTIRELKIRAAQSQTTDASGAKKKKKHLTALTTVLSQHIDQAYIDAPISSPATTPNRQSMVTEMQSMCPEFSSTQSPGPPNTSQMHAGGTAILR